MELVEEVLHEKELGHEPDRLKESINASEGGESEVLHIRPREMRLPRVPDRDLAFEEKIIELSKDLTKDAILENNNFIGHRIEKAPLREHRFSDNFDVTEIELEMESSLKKKQSRREEEMPELKEQEQL